MSRTSSLASSLEWACAWHVQRCDEFGGVVVRVFCFVCWGMPVSERADVDAEPRHMLAKQGNPRTRAARAWDMLAHGALWGSRMLRIGNLVCLRKYSSASEIALFRFARIINFINTPLCNAPALISARLTRVWHARAPKVNNTQLQHNCVCSGVLCTRAHIGTCVLSRSMDLKKKQTNNPFSISEDVGVYFIVCLYPVFDDMLPFFFIQCVMFVAYNSSECHPTRTMTDYLIAQHYYSALTDTTHHHASYYARSAREWSRLSGSRLLSFICCASDLPS